MHAVAHSPSQNVPQLEKFVMEGLFWSDTPLLQVARHSSSVAVAVVAARAISIMIGVSVERYELL